MPTDKPQRTVLKLTNSMRQILTYLRINGTQDTLNFMPAPLVYLAEAGYVRINTRATLTHRGKIVADHLIANSR